MTQNAENLTAIKSKTLEIMTELRKHEEKLKNLQNMADMKIYDMNHILELRDNENTRFYNVDANLRGELKQRIDNLFDNLAESKANISAPAFSNALSLIGMLGSEMDAKTLNDLITNFRGKIAELNILKKACVSANVGNCIAIFDDYVIGDDYREVMKRQTSNLLVFAHSFGIVAEILGEEIRIDAETVSADAGRAFSNNKMVL